MRQMCRTTKLARRRGLTLVELLLALAILSLISLTTGVMLSAVAYGTDSDRDIRALVARNKMLSARITAALRGSGMVLEVGSNSDGTWAVLWERDLDGNDVPSLLEIRRLEYDAAAGTLASHAAPDGTTDVVYTLSDDFLVITDALMGTASFTETLWAQDVTGFEISHRLSDPQLEKLISYQLTLSENGFTDTTIGTSYLRNF